MTSGRQLCRSCLSSNVSFHYILGENVTTEIYYFCTSIEVSQDDLPKTLCDGCYERLLKYSEFKKTCLESQNTLLISSFNESKESSCKAESDNKLTHNTEEEVKGTQDNHDMKTENEYVNYFDYSFIKTEVLSDHYNDDLSEAGNPCDSSMTNHKKSKQRQIKKAQKPNKSRVIIKKLCLAFACNICNKKFKYHQRLEAHKLEHEGKAATMDCLSCNKTFATWTGLKRHNESEHTRVSLDKLKCKICGKVYKNQQTMKSHEKIHEKRIFCICDICGKRFTSKFILKDHIDTHTQNRERNFTCERCGKKFYTQKVLHTHISKRHSGRRYICHVCNYPFIDKYNLVKHLQKHDGKKLYKCEICKKTFATQASLVEHRRIHSGEKPYSCSYCTKRFLSNRRLKDHVRIHTGERPYKCTLCYQGFTQRGSLKRHMKVHDRTVSS